MGGPLSEVEFAARYNTTRPRGARRPEHERLRDSEGDSSPLPPSNEDALTEEELAHPDGLMGFSFHCPHASGWASWVPWNSTWNRLKFISSSWHKERGHTRVTGVSGVSFRA